MRSALAAAAAAAAASADKPTNISEAVEPAAEERVLSVRTATASGRRLSSMQRSSFDDVGISGRRMSVQPTPLQPPPLQQQQRRRSGWQARRFKKEMSLDGDAVGASRHKRQLKQQQDRAESLMRAGGKRSSCDSLPAWRTKPEQKSSPLAVKKMDTATVVEESVAETAETAAGAATSSLSVPLQQRHRASSLGSTRQLFKQKAMEEEPEADENSLLLPMDAEEDHRERKDGEEGRGMV